MTAMADPSGPLDQTPGPDANTIVGLLADADRRRVLAAIELGATTLDGAATVAGLTDQRASKALGKLVDAGIVTATPSGLVVDGTVIARAARSALQRPPSNEHAAEPPDTRKVLDAFVRDGRITSMPISHAKRRVVLDFLARGFEPGRRYAESEVNAVLDGHAEDPAALRRYLVDETFLDRTDGMYWRVGGTVDLTAPDAERSG